MILYKYLSKDRLHILEDRFLWFSRPFAFNDPFEMNPHFETLEDFSLPVPAGASAAEAVEISEFERIVREGFRDPRVRSYHMHRSVSTIVTYCLSARRDGLLMWAHYSDSHTGFVVGFDSDHRTIVGNSLRRTEPVIYTQTRPSRATLADVTNEDLLFTKGKEWEYEEEWRIVDSLFEADYDFPICNKTKWAFRFHPDAVREVIIGCRADPDFEARVKAALTAPKYAHVTLLKADLHDREYSLTFRRIPRP